MSVAANRGALIVLEGIDKVGKTTQARAIVKELESKGVKCEGISFPNRTTPMGILIDKYLKKEIKIDSKEAVTLLFIANRWECKAEIECKLGAGITLICDRYTLSGRAYALANGIRPSIVVADDELTVPDLTLYFTKDTPFVENKGTSDASTKAEIYETTSFQKRAQEAFEVYIRSDGTVQTVNVTDKTIPIVLSECMKHIYACRVKMEAGVASK
jgi:dTMP kinase